MSTPVEQLRPERRRRDERRVDADRAQVGVQAEPAAQREERLLGPDRGRRIGPLRPTDRAEQDRVGRAAGGEVLVADRDAVGVDGGAADDVLGPVDVEAEPAARRVDDAPGGGHDLRPDAVARDRRDAVGRATPGPAAVMAASRPGAATRTPPTTPLISAPWSLLTATRYASSEASMMFVDNPCPVTTSAPGPLVGRAPAADEDLALGVLAGATPP